LEPWSVLGKEANRKTFFCRAAKKQRGGGKEKGDASVGATNRPSDCGVEKFLKEEERAGASHYT